MREHAPGHESHWFEVYDRVVRSGEPQRFVNEAGRASGAGYDVFAFRVGGRAEPARRHPCSNDAHGPHARASARARARGAPARTSFSPRSAPRAAQTRSRPIRNAVSLLQLRGRRRRRAAPACRAMLGPPGHLPVAPGGRPARCEPHHLRQGEFTAHAARPARRGARTRLTTTQPFLALKSHRSRPGARRGAGLGERRPHPPLAQVGRQTCCTTPRAYNAGRRQHRPRGRDGGRRGLHHGRGQRHRQSTPPDLEKVFEPFTQLHDGEAVAAGGIGIGLSLARARWSSCTAATISGARSAGPGAGSRFVVCLPRGAPARRIARMPFPRRGRKTGRRLLVVDDNVDPRDQPGAACCAQLGHQVGGRLSAARRRSRKARGVPPGDRAGSTSACRAWTASRWRAGCATRTTAPSRSWRRPAGGQDEGPPPQRREAGFDAHPRESRSTLATPAGAPVASRRASSRRTGSRPVNILAMEAQARAFGPGIWPISPVRRSGCCSRRWSCSSYSAGGAPEKERARRCSASSRRSATRG